MSGTAVFISFLNELFIICKANPMNGHNSSTICEMVIIHLCNHQAGGCQSDDTVVMHGTYHRFSCAGPHMAKSGCLPLRIGIVWVPPSDIWQHLGAFLWGLAESECPPQTNGKIWVPSSEDWHSLSTPLQRMAKSGSPPPQKKASTPSNVSWIVPYRK